MVGWVGGWMDGAALASSRSSTDGGRLANAHGDEEADQAVDLLTVKGTCVCYCLFSLLLVFICCLTVKGMLGSP